MSTIIEVVCLAASITCLGRLDTGCKVSYNTALLTASCAFALMAMTMEGVWL